MAKDSEAARLRSIPSIERILSSGPFAELAAHFGRARVKAGVVGYVAGLRESTSLWHPDEAAARVRELLESDVAPSLRRVINGSGVIIHTNLGRSPISREIWDEAESLVAGYANLEYDLERGERGARDEHLSSLCATLFGAEAAVLANNNAAATLLLLASVAAGQEVLVSRGELVEIGGSFRVPDVIQQGGAKLREVGTTNRTRARDYDVDGAAILRVHRSNFEIVGFTESPTVEELVEVAHKRGIPMLYDEGSGRVVDLERYGFARGETLRELVAKGCDAVTCSTDKLIGATQGGLILGRAEVIARVKKHPLMRALRAGKESYAVIAATLRAFASERHEQRIPIYRMLATPIAELRARAESLHAKVIESRCALGGGTTPTETIASIAVEIPGNANELQSHFLRLRTPIVGRVVDDRFTIEMRTLLDEDLDAVRAALE